MTPTTVSSSAIHERPIIFSTPMIQAILDGRKKTQTRRLIHDGALRVDLRAEVRGDWPLGDDYVAPPGRYRAKLNRGGAVTIASQGKDFDLGVKPGEFHLACPYAAGNTVLADYGSSRGWRTKWTVLPKPSRLWVRETWCRGTDEDASEYAHEAYKIDLSDRPRGPVYPGCDYPAFAYYAATDPDIVNSNDEDRSPWKSPIHMPRWACRLVLDVVGVRIERLQELTEEDAQAEGVAPFFERFPCFNRDQRITDTELAREAPYRASYACSWDEINGDRALWSANPWVWVIEFRPRAVAAEPPAPRDLAEFPLAAVHAAGGIHHREAA